MFQFPSNGKAYPKIIATVDAKVPQYMEFQFPSNGKAYPKRDRFDERNRIYAVLVSIPFKRESGAKVRSAAGSQWMSSFNSLQTGKRSQRHQLWRKCCHSSVSIPFKRESGAKEGDEIHFYRGDDLFQFPSNGKAYPKTQDLQHHGEEVVQFQFPSNGKAYPKFTTTTPQLTTLIIDVSIPFKRESISKVDAEQGVWVTPDNKVSIPFKRESLSKVGYKIQGGQAGYPVSIPFKRESLSKGPWRGLKNNGASSLVSIPFKRESLSKVYWKNRNAPRRLVSIPFKRESLSKVIF